ncbi:DoxX family protein [Prolixibacter denitrificans]|jgi:hypothetical protein|uniref:DoxX-like protein n=1 Tax=Prolixibacter denitrificans TaxID=1541063 RepID=A0A2P8C8G3_9BACT|nr:DoxX family protein [Prolixibacter denitrificans]PSK81256.1 DoxX-like protein [Prolixibacter denitrificans]GET21660.1 hypothetical protein JCM18694_19060 [Prolixibacter denitrificans]
MNILLWILQILLALHTIMGAIWKFTNPASTVSSLQSIPHGVWQTLGIIEFLCAIGLFLPALTKRLAILPPIAALIIVVEMLGYIGLSFYSGDTNYSHSIYWLTVAAISAFIAYGRLELRPL